MLIFLFFNITRGAQWLPSERFYLLSLHNTRDDSPGAAPPQNFPIPKHYVPPQKNPQKHSDSPGSTAALWWAWVPICVPSQQILSLHVKCAVPQIWRPTKNCASPEFSYSLTLHGGRNGPIKNRSTVVNRTTGPVESFGQNCSVYFNLLAEMVPIKILGRDRDLQPWLEVFHLILMLVPFPILHAPS